MPDERDFSPGPGAASDPARPRLPTPVPRNPGLVPIRVGATLAICAGQFLDPGGWAWLTLPLIFQPRTL